MMLLVLLDLVLLNPLPLGLALHQALMKRRPFELMLLVLVLEVPLTQLPWRCHGIRNNEPGAAAG
jgi:hypothetical protein